MSLRHSEAMKLRWQDPAYRAAKLAQMRQPEIQERRAEGIRKRFRSHAHHALGRERPGTAKATVSPTTRDLAWAAGFLEGEGSFCQSTPGKASTYVSCYQVNKEPVARLLALFGGALSQREGRQRLGTDCSPVWVWRVSGSRARGVAMTLYPMMSQKRQGQIQNALRTHAATA